MFYETKIIIRAAIFNVEYSKYCNKSWIDYNCLIERSHWYGDSRFGSVRRFGYANCKDVDSITAIWKDI